jgi:hypothetical protein
MLGPITVACSASSAILATPGRPSTGAPATQVGHRRPGALPPARPRKWQVFLPKMRGRRGGGNDGGACGGGGPSRCSKQPARTKAASAGGGDEPEDHRGSGCGSRLVVPPVRAGLRLGPPRKRRSRRLLPRRRMDVVEALLGRKRSPGSEPAPGTAPSGVDRSNEIGYPPAYGPSLPIAA